jgi:hypothetical protein
MKQWTLQDGLKVIREQVGEDREVDVELGRRGRGYLDEGYQRVSMGFGEYWRWVYAHWEPGYHLIRLYIRMAGRSDMIERLRRATYM